MTPMTCFGAKEKDAGLQESVLIIQIPMEQAVLYHLLLLPIWTKGFDLETSVERAKDYISGALAAMLDLGKGSGPMDHGFAIDNEYTREAK